jgi:microcystin degradation protein MlrC
VRFFVAMVSHETNTFSPIRTDRGQFEARDLRYGGEILEAYRGTGTCLGGMIDGAAARGVTLVPSLAASASPAGRVSKEFYAEARDRLVADLRAAGPLDGVLLDLHGAMVVEGVDDGEGDLLQAVRTTVVGIDPLGEKILVVKSSIHYRAAFEPIARAILEVDAPGLSSSNLARFTFTRVRRPIFPLDDM